jgi:hypothetical protein
MLIRWLRVRPIPARDQQRRGEDEESKTTQDLTHAKLTAPSPPPRSGFVQQIAAANPDWRWQFRYRGRRVLVPGG